MNETETKNLNAVEDLAGYQAVLAGPPWLGELRARALERFNSSDWPTTQEEEWRRTNLSPFEFDTYETPAEPADEPSITTTADRAGLVHSHDGTVVGAELRDDLAGRGVVFGPLLDVVESDPALGDEIRAILERSLEEADNRLQYWHFAMLADAVVLRVPANVAVDRPFEIRVGFDGDEIVHAPHLVVILERGAEASVVRTVRSAEDGEVLVVDGSEFVVGDGARLRYLNLQRMNEESIYFCNDRGNVSRDGHVHRTEVALGSDFVKTRYVSELTGPGADAVLNGIYFGTDEQHIDARTVQHHRAPHTTSRAFYRGAVTDESHSIYQGLIQVERAAAGTDAYLTNKNLILGDAARADSIPSLNIKTDDVRCSHGSTTGKLDESQIFYLQCRGYNRVEAKRMLVEGYFEDLIEQLPESSRDEIRGLIMERIPEVD